MTTNTAVAETIKTFNYTISATKAEFMQNIRTGNRISVIFSPPHLQPGDSLLINSILPPGVSSISATGNGTFQAVSSGNAYVGSFPSIPEGICVDSRGVLSSNISACNAIASGKLVATRGLASDQNYLIVTYALANSLYEGASSSYTTEELPVKSLAMYWDETTNSTLVWLSQIQLNYYIEDVTTYDKWLSGEIPSISSSLSASVNPSGSGSISGSLGSGINCSPTKQDCQDSYAAGTKVTLTATPNKNYSFINWSGDCGQGSLNTVTVTIDANKSCTANFQPLSSEKVTLTVNVTGNGTISSSDSTLDCKSEQNASCNTSFQKNSVITLMAKANTGSSFSGWSGDCTSLGSNSQGFPSAQVTMSSARSCSAKFVVGDVSTTPGNTTTVVNVTSDAQVLAVPFGNGTFSNDTKVTMAARLDNETGYQWWKGKSIYESADSVLTLTDDYNSTLSLSAAINTTSTDPMSVAIVALWTTKTNATTFAGEWYQKSGYSPLFDMYNELASSSTNTWSYLPQFKIDSLTQLLDDSSTVKPLFSDIVINKQYSLLIGAGNITPPKEMQNVTNRLVQFFVLYRKTVAQNPKQYTYLIALGPTVSVPDSPETITVKLNAQKSFAVSNVNSCDQAVADTSILKAVTTTPDAGICTYTAAKLGTTKFYGIKTYLVEVTN